jgi:FtsP/CotA-like multicopper oxidase with cupredoxin domain
MDRRRFVLSSATLAFASSFDAVLGQPAAPSLRLAESTQQLVGSQHPATTVWAYNGIVPGPVLRFQQGDRLRIGVENALRVETTVHWHGIRLPNAMDGVPHVTQAPIAAHGGRFVYEFDLPDAGTYWYHPHVGSSVQVARGLYGALVVQEAEPPPVERDLVWVLSDWRLDRQARVLEDFGSAMDSSHAGRVGNTVTVNGQVLDSFAVRAGERIRLRLINAATARIFGLAFEGHSPWVIAHDGQPVPPHRPESDRVVLGPGMRADLILDCAGAPGSAHRIVDDFYQRRPYRLLHLQYSAEEAIRRSFPPPPALPSNPLTALQLDGAPRHRIVFGGGAMGAMPSQREHRGLFWTVNGKPVAEHAHHDGPLLSLTLGRTYVLELTNQTSWHHPIHLHGHVFRVLSREGKPVVHERWADTVLLDPDSRTEIALVADNPGQWMLHCHVLEHQASGMMALIRVG